MDRIDTQAAKGILPGLKAQGAVRVQAAHLKGETLETGGVPVSSVATAGAEPPVDSGRVAEIRKAVEEGRYALAPAKIADAMIGSGLLVRMR